MGAKQSDMKRLTHEQAISLRVRIVGSLALWCRDQGIHNDIESNEQHPLADELAFACLYVAAKFGVDLTTPKAEAIEISKLDDEEACPRCGRRASCPNAPHEEYDPPCARCDLPRRF